MTSIRLESVLVNFPGLGIHDLPVSKEAFHIGPFSIYWYGICIALAFFVCVLLAARHVKRFGFTVDDLLDYLLFIVPSALIGTRVYYVLSSWSTFAADWTSIFDFRNGGLAVYGGIIFSAISVFFVSRKKKKNIAATFDFLVVYIPLGQAIGRWGNFFNQEAFGTNTDLPWGMISSATSNYIRMACPDLDPNLPVHPMFLYESLATLLIFFLLLVVRNRSRRPFTTISMYCILYGSVRFFLEGNRTDALFIGQTGLRTSQVVSAVLVIAGFFVMAIVRYLGLERQTAAEEELTEEEKKILSKYSISLSDEEEGVSKEKDEKPAEKSPENEREDTPEDSSEEEEPLEESPEDKGETLKDTSKDNRKS